MFRSNSPLGNDTSSYVGSIQSNGYSAMDDGSSLVSNLSKPSAKSIYLQRKEYAASINKMMNKFQYKVEHLFTCDLDGKELRSITDCVDRLKLLDGMGRVWGQGMLLEVRGADLLLTDIETKEELDTMALSEIQELKAVLDCEAFNSLLTVSVQPKRKHTTTVFMFQCEDVRADYVQKDLSRALSRRREDSSISNAGLIDAYAGMKNLHNAAKSSDPKKQQPAVDSVPQWRIPDYEEEDVHEPELVVPQEEEEEEEEEEEDDKEIPSPQPFTTKEEPRPPPRPYTELDRDIDILNHIISDIEIFMGQVAAEVAKNTKKKKKKKKGKVMDDMLPAAEFAACLHKIKCGFNLLGELNGKINNPSAPDFVHSLFSTLAFLVSHCAKDLPPTIIAPLLTPQCIRLMSEEASAEEDQLWQSLGDSWNIPSTKWPEDDEDIPTYTLEFFDGWQPPEVSAAAEPQQPVSRQRESPRPAPGWTSAKWTPARPPQKARLGESKLRPMRVTSDFISRNHRELTVRKGEIVELLDMSKQWWKVRSSGGEEGFVPNNILEACDEQPMEVGATDAEGQVKVSIIGGESHWVVPESSSFTVRENKMSDCLLFPLQTGGPPVLAKKSKPAEVKAWLEDKGFSKITVRCLGGLSGSMLLGMTRDELKAVCPEEGGRVFFQLQAVKVAMAAAI